MRCLIYGGIDGEEKERGGGGGDVAMGGKEWLLIIVDVIVVVVVVMYRPTSHQIKSNQIAAARVEKEKKGIEERTDGFLRGVDEQKEPLIPFRELHVE